MFDIEYVDDGGSKTRRKSKRERTERKLFKAINEYDEQIAINSPLVSPDRTHVRASEAGYCTNMMLGKRKMNRTFASKLYMELGKAAETTMRNQLDDMGMLVGHNVSFRCIRKVVSGEIDVIIDYKDGRGPLVGEIKCGGSLDLNARHIAQLALYSKVANLDAQLIYLTRRVTVKEKGSYKPDAPRKLELRVYNFSKDDPRFYDAWTNVFVAHLMRCKFGSEVGIHDPMALGRRDCQICSEKRCLLMDRLTQASTEGLKAKAATLATSYLSCLKDLNLGLKLLDMELSAGLYDVGPYRL